MAQTLKKVLWLAVVAFLLYAIVTNPGKSGETVHSLWGAIIDGIHHIGAFFQSIIDSSK